MNRKRRKQRKMELRRKGLEQYTPPHDSIITMNPGNVSTKIYRFFNGMEIQAGKLRGYAFYRPWKKKMQV